VDPLLDWEGDKPTVLALREIGAGLVDDKMVRRREESDAQKAAAKAFEVVEENPFADD
jgi:DNA-directed RNA polymerase subunit omega